MFQKLLHEMWGLNYELIISNQILDKSFKMLNLGLYMINIIIPYIDKYLVHTNQRS